MLDVDGGDDVDPRVEDRIHVLPPLLVVRAGGVRVCEFVDQGDVGMPRDHGIQVHFGELDAAMLDGHPRNDLQTGEHRRRGVAVVGFHDRDDHVFAQIPKPAALFEHRVRLTDTGRRTEQHPQAAAGGHAALPYPFPLGSSCARAMFSWSTLTVGSPR